MMGGAKDKDPGGIRLAVPLVRNPKGTFVGWEKDVLGPDLLDEMAEVRRDTVTTEEEVKNLRRRLAKAGARLGAMGSSRLTRLSESSPVARSFIAKLEEKILLLSDAVKRGNVAGVRIQKRALRSFCHQRPGVKTEVIQVKGREIRTALWEANLKIDMTKIEYYFSIGLKHIFEEVVTKTTPEVTVIEYKAVEGPIPESAPKPKKKRKPKTNANS
jgi:hypothetical protein